MRPIRPMCHGRASPYPYHDCAPGKALILEVQVPYGPMAGTVSQGQLRHREVGWRGSRRQNSEPTNRHRIAGRCGGVTQQRMGKPKGQSDTRTGKSGGHRVKDQCLTLGDLLAPPKHRSRVLATALDKRGEVSRSRSNPCERMKG
jgi:hypothetical protein